MGWDGLVMGWDGMRWDGMGWDGAGMGWDGLTEAKKYSGNTCLFSAVFLGVLRPAATTCAGRIGRALDAAVGRAGDRSTADCGLERVTLPVRTLGNQ
jgi:hypothetical protein